MDWSHIFSREVQIILHCLSFMWRYGDFVIKLFLKNGH